MNFVLSSTKLILEVSQASNSQPTQTNEPILWGQLGNWAIQNFNLKLGDVISSDNPILFSFSTN